MILKSLSLINIRSYTLQKVEFKEGISLLCGDIGAGKSTILLAIEFALFGIRRPDLSGTMLLRNGARHGSVELVFEVGGKTVRILRTLKRTLEEVKQDSGSIIMDDKKTDCTPIELKARILALLGYPDILVTKSKSLLWRYTVYAAQEEMKQIVLQDPEERLEILRKIFGIDRYRRMTKNTQIFRAQLRQKMAYMGGKIEDLTQKKEREKVLRAKLEALSQTLESKQEPLKKMIQELQQTKAEWLILEEAWLVKREQERKLVFLKQTKLERISQLTVLAQSIQKLLSESTVLEKQRELLPQQGERKESLLAKHKKIDEEYKQELIMNASRRQETASLLALVEKAEKELAAIQVKIAAGQTLTSQIEELKTRLVPLTQIMQKKEELSQKSKQAQVTKALLERESKELSSLLACVHDKAVCPTCRQEITHQYRTSIEENTKLQTLALAKKAQELSLLSRDYERELTDLGARECSIREWEQRIQRLRVEYQSVLHHTERAEILRNELGKAKARIDSLGPIDEEKEKTLKAELAAVASQILFSEKREMMMLKESQTRQLLSEKLEEKEKLGATLLLLEQEEKILDSQLAEKKEIDAKIALQRSLLETLQQNLEKHKLETLSLQKDREALQNEKSILDVEIAQKTVAKESMEACKQFLNWLDTSFVPIVTTIEKHLLLRIYHEFNDLFQKWFSMLIGDESLSLRLDEVFTPVVLQNGYESTLENLSGGERSAAALSYRLALNAVASQIGSRLQSGNLLILDEPTEGFSPDQLDRLRDVLTELSIPQILIVSHDTKIETYVDHIIRVHKSEHVSECDA